MNAREIFRALQAGEINPENAKEKLIKNIKSLSVEHPEEYASPLSQKRRFITSSSNQFWHPSIEEQLPSVNKNESEKITPPIFQIHKIESRAEKNNPRASEARDYIAIVGMSGRYPKASNLDQYWDNLVQGKNSIREIPKSRWDVNQYYDPNPSQKGKVYCKWIGLLEDIEYFDPLFFNISPVEAEVMDPQHRLFLQEGYRAFEDAGYGSQLLNNNKCGVYLGIMSNEYGTLLYQNNPGLTDITGNSFAIAAARIAYYLNLKGPAIPIDTACSSSLVATHLACQALLHHEIDMALVGGVTLYLIPESYISMCTAGVLSPEGQCKTFDNSADGFVPGEGVGALVLKRLQDAQADHDHIYSVIIGSGINQDGKTNGITAPSVTSQIELERNIYNKYKINPEGIHYVEMHGTGTKLGDPIELEALSTVFKERTNKRNYCAIGSVKSNIGHTSAAAGVASIHKVLLCMKHKKLVPTLHFKTPNEHFNFKDSPFYVNTELKPWDMGLGNPRRASVSSFGFSGTNAHIVIEEYPSRVEGMRTPILIDINKPILFVLSAKTEAQLKIYAESIKRYIEREADLNLVDMAYTLQVGREAMDYRLAFVTDSKETLLKALEGFIKNGSWPGVLKAQVKRHKNGVALFEDDEDVKEILQSWIQKKKFNKIAELWVKGVTIDWEQLYIDNKPHRICLPTYHFERKRYWFQSILKSNNRWSSFLHPLLDKIDPKGSLGDGIVLQKTLQNTDLILEDHNVQGQSTFPEVGYLEMAYAAGFIISEEKSIRLSNVKWLQPLYLEAIKKKVKIILKRWDKGLKFEIQSYSDSGIKIHSEGLLHVQENITTGGIDQRLSIEEIKERCSYRIEQNTFYKDLKKFGLGYGPYFQVLKELWRNEEESLGILVLPTEYKDELNRYFLQTSMMSGALQVVVSILLNDGKKNQRLMMPFSLKELEVFHPFPACGYCYIKPIENYHYNVAILDETGLVCVKFHDLALQERKDPFDRFFYRPVWKRSVLSSSQCDIEDVGKRKKNILIIYASGGKWLKEKIASFHIKDKVIEIKLGSENLHESEGIWEIKMKDPYALQKCIGEIERVDIIYFLGGIYSKGFMEGDLMALDQSQDLGVLSLFRLVKALSRHGFIDHPLNLKVVTNDVYKIYRGDEIIPYAASIHGFTKSMAKEYPQWKVSCIDISLKDLSEISLEKEIDSIVRAIVIEPAGKNGLEVVIRSAHRYVRSIEPIIIPPVHENPFRYQGVYLILGGAGGIGLTLGLYLAEEVKARLILIGRRELSNERKKEIADIKLKGGEVMYVRADGTNIESMKNAIKQARPRFGAINGVIHSAIVLRDKSIENMDEETFRAALAPKVKASIVLHQVLKGESLDFMMFFSSIQSFSCNAGQSNYAAGSIFEDVFAAYLEQKESYPVKIINWGYWGSVGIVATERYNELLSAQGVHSITPKEGMEVVRRTLGNGVNQIIAIKAEDEVLKKLGVEFSTQIKLLPIEIPSIIRTIFQ